MRSGCAMRFEDRLDAGRRLAELLAPLAPLQPVVVGLPRGGVPVAAAVAKRLSAPLDVVVVRKIGAPCQPELGLGAVGEEGVRVINPLVVQQSGVSLAQLAAAEREAQHELLLRVRALRQGRPRISLVGRNVIVVDDGIATGSTARAACQVVRAEGATRVIMATPVAPAATLTGLRDVTDDIVCVVTPRPFYAIGQFYDDFAQVDDSEVVALLDQGGT